MFFPIGDDQIRGGAYPIFSYTFLVVNILVFLWQYSLSPEDHMAFVLRYSTTPLQIEQGLNLYTLGTSMFLHGGWFHLLSNMLFLWVFADNIEATIGNLPFFLFYVASGVFASLAHVYFNLGSEVPSLGASGAVSGVLGAYLVMFPRSKVKVMLFLLIILRRITMTALAFLGIWILLQVAQGINSMSLTSDGGGTAWWAHIGGFAFGMIAGLLFRGQARRFQLS